jgi:hypothetical protein
MNANKMGITLGSDPEMMLWDKDQRKIVSSIPILKRDKHDPIDLGDGMKMYADNVLVESAFEPSTTKEGFVSTIRTAIIRMQEKLGERYSLLPQSAHLYDADELKEKSCWESGCNPNYDVYARTMNLPAKFESGLRTGSFHIHIGSEKLIDHEDKDKAIKLLDIFLGCSSIVFDGDKTSSARRALYGKAGEFRPTPYGVEYRVLGNFALRSPKTTELVVDLVAYTMEQIYQGKADEIIASSDQDNVVQAINSGMKGLANSILQSSGLPRDLFERVNKQYNPKFNVAWGI